MKIILLLKKLLTDETLKMTPMNSKQIPTTVVGFTEAITKDEFIKQFSSLNYLLKQFSESNVLEEHVKIHNIIPTKEQDYVFQPFVSVSAILRAGL